MINSSAEIPLKKTTQEKTFLQKHGQKLIGAAIWLILVGAYLTYSRANDLTFRESMLSIANVLTSPLGPLIYIVLYVLRPILFFPAALISLAGGAIFGPVMGVLWVVVGSNLSALLAFFVGRFFGDGLLDETEAGGVIQKYANRMRENSFETVLIMRFVYLPYDLVNYVAGILNIDWKEFLLATAIGSIPGTIMITVAGASFGSLEAALSGTPPSLNPALIAISVAMFVVSIGLSRYFKNRESSKEEKAPVRD